MRSLFNVVDVNADSGTFQKNGVLDALNVVVSKDMPMVYSVDQKTKAN